MFTNMFPLWRQRNRPNNFKFQPRDIKKLYSLCERFMSTQWFRYPIIEEEKIWFTFPKSRLHFPTLSQTIFLKTLSINKFKVGHQSSLHYHLRSCKYQIANERLMFYNYILYTWIWNNIKRIKVFVRVAQLQQTYLFFIYLKLWPLIKHGIMCFYNFIYTKKNLNKYKQVIRN